MAITSEQWASFARDGYVKLGKVATDEELAALNSRLDDIMLGRVSYDSLLMQLDPSSTASASPAAGDAYEASGAATQGQTPGFKGASLAYRKIGEAEGGLECDPVFAAFMRKPIFVEACDRVYGAHVPVSVYRAMVMSKPSGDLGGGTPLPWHQDGGEWWALTHDPLIFVCEGLFPPTPLP